MKNECIVILGATGTLGYSVVPLVKNYCGSVLLFDKNENARLNITACDLRKSEQITKVISDIDFNKKTYWRLLVTAGTYNGKCGINTPWPDVLSTLEINLVGICHFTYLFVQSLLRYSLRGRIVIVTSAAARVGSQDIGYGIAKAGLEGLVRSLSKSFAFHGITTVGVAPGLFQSAMSDAQAIDRKEAVIKSTHIKRMIDLTEIRDVVSYALFAAPDALTGTFLSPNGGQISN